MPHRLLEADGRAMLPANGCGRALSPVTVRTARFAEVAPEALAVSDGSRGLSYLELDRKSNQMAHGLIQMGVGPESVVALLLERTTDFLLAALSVMKAGGAYLPLDSSNPHLRIQAIVDDARPVVVISHRGLARSISHRVIVDLDVARTAYDTLSDSALDTTPGPRDLAYVIYTSGSTGTPKGVEIEHGALANLVDWHQQAFRVSPSDRASQTAGLGFDASVWEVWPYLSAGASVHIATDENRRSPEALRDWMVQSRITIGFAATVMAEQLMTLEWPAVTKLRTLLTGAEALRKRPGADLPFVLVNNYGPTECTVVATSGIVSGGGSGRPSIGSPILNTKVHLLDAEMHPVPAGELGEICIAGAGLARGYRGMAEETRSRFVANPWGDPGSRMYRTGDLGRLLDDGEIEFCGRFDDQVKIRGYRVEPDEVSACLLACKGVAQAVVVTRESSSGDRHLVAYLVAETGAVLSAKGVREELSTKLPDYMVPPVFVQLAGLPLNANGKCDRRALPEPDSSNTLPFESTGGTAKRVVEQRVAETLAAVLGVKSVGLDDNFFMMGGHSMMAAQLTTRLRETFGVRVTLRQLFGAPTLASLSTLIEKLTEQPAP